MVGMLREPFYHQPFDDPKGTIDLRVEYISGAIAAAKVHNSLNYPQAPVELTRSEQAAAPGEVV
jgi:hypothetical protein